MRLPKAIGRVPRQRYRPEAHDLWSAALFFAFAIFSLAWPHTGNLKLGAWDCPHGYFVALLLSVSGLLALWLGSRDFSRMPRFVRFLRCFYPQAFFAPLFAESIVLSSQPWGGAPRDAIFAALDKAIFGFYPAREFSAALGQIPWWNELMFGAYFSFYFILVATPWFPWFRGDEAEGERESSILAGFMFVVYVFYVFFRVVGPKHYLPDLAAAGYGDFHGGFFTKIEDSILSIANTTGAAFPSSHVAVSLMMTSFIYKTKRRLLPFYVADCALIAIATVYIRAHWAVDVLGGALASLLLVPILSRFWYRLGTARRKSGVH
jgi:membrane-associated phospholipid phosphatase